MYSPLLGDEAVRWAFSQDFAKSENKEMKKLFVQHRPKRLIQFLNMPEFTSLDSKYRHISHYWVRIMQRTDKSAVAIIARIDKSEVPDKWHLKLFQDLLGSYNEDTPMKSLIEKCNKLIRKHPCVFDYFSIPPLPDKIYQEYEEYRNMKVFEKKEQGEDIDQKQVAKIAAHNLINRWPLFSGEIKRARFDRPTVRILEKYIFSHPKTEEPIVRYTTVRNWIKEIARAIKKE